jgi:heme-degrading monooxygenase HmoA
VAVPVFKTGVGEDLVQVGSIPIRLRVTAPEVGQVLTVFRSRLRADGVEAYAPHARRMSELARSMPGYVEHKAFTADDGERVTVVVFADEASHRAWRDHPEHRAAQQEGVRYYYDAYSIAVGEIDYASAFSRPVR